MSVENGIVSIGFRKMASYARVFCPDIEVCYITPTNLCSPIEAIVNFGNVNTDLPTKDIKRIAEYLANADMVCFSSMTPLADLIFISLSPLISDFRSRHLNSFHYDLW